MSYDGPEQDAPVGRPGRYPPPGGPYPPGAPQPGGAPSPYGPPSRSGSEPYDAPLPWEVKPQPGQPLPGNPDQPTQRFPTYPNPPTQPLGAEGPAGPAEQAEQAGPAEQAEQAEQAPPPPPNSGRRSNRLLVPLVAVSVLALLATAGFVYVTLREGTMQDVPEGTPAATGRAANLPAGRTWLSGAWTGGGINAQRINDFSQWRGQPADVVTTYPAYDTWDELRNSEWHISTFDGYDGRLSYGLPLLPKNKEGGLGDVAEGRYDDVFASVAKSLVKHNRGDTFVRIGLEANGTWFPWGATAERAEQYTAAWRRVQQVMKAEAPDLVFGFDITCGKALEGGNDRLDNLNKLYPGDDVVDIVGCDHYDSYTVKTRNEAEWEQTLRPRKAAGLADVADFARRHGKKLAVPEWGLTAAGPDSDGKDRDGVGDNPYFIYSMYSYFQQNKDILVYENYFNEPADYLASSIWEPVQHPKASAEYRKLWSAPPNLAQK